MFEIDKEHILATSAVKLLGMTIDLRLKNFLNITVVVLRTPILWVMGLMV